jgi:CHAT domain-containing protein
VFLELADLLLRRAAGDPVARQPGLLRARGVVENLKTAELADYFEDECLAQLQARAAPLDRLLAEAQAAVLYPVILPDRLELLLSLPDGTLARAAAPVSAAELERSAGRLRLALQGLGDALPHARQLHEWLIAPIAGELAGHDVATLVFVPDGPLRSIPLAALHDGERYLVERYAVATSPGLSLLDPRPIARTKVRLLAAGLTESVGGFPPLPQVGEELRAIGALYAGGTVLQDAAFDAARLAAELEAVPYTVVHVASHAQFSSDPEQTFVLTHDGRLGLDGLERLLAPSRFREEPVELIALSACETAAGDDRAALGLAGVAVKAGARSALATLWQVSDEATAVAAAEFYRQLGAADAPSKAEALRRAQLMLLADGRYREPFYWAPFLLIGNWL